MVRRGLERAADSRGTLGRLLRRRKIGLTREEALEAHPVRNLEVQSSVDEEGELVLQIERRRDLFGKVLGFVVAAPLTKKVSLDDMGSFVWNLCDGKRSVREIASLLAGKYRLNRREAVLSLTTFLRSLGRKGLVGFAVIKENHHGSSTT